MLKGSVVCRFLLLPGTAGSEWDFVVWHGLSTGCFSRLPQGTRLVASPFLAWLCPSRGAARGSGAWQEGQALVPPPRARSCCGVQDGAALAPCSGTLCPLAHVRFHSLCRSDAVCERGQGRKGKGVILGTEERRLELGCWDTRRLQQHRAPVITLG